MNSYEIWDAKSKNFPYKLRDIIIFIIITEKNSGVTIRVSLT